MPSFPSAASAPGDIVRLDANSSVNPTGPFALSGFLTPPTIGANQDNYNPAGLSTAAVLRLAASTPGFDITGLAGGAAGRVIVIHNIGAFPLVLKDDGISSTAANRFALTTDMTLSADSVAFLQYDATSLRWRAISGGGGGGSPSGPAGGDLADTYPNPTVAQASKSFALNGVITPTTLAANTNDYAPTGLATATFLRLSASTPGFKVTGLTGGASGRVLVIHNVGSFPLTLTDEDAASTAANRFALTAQLTLVPDACCILQYDATASRWRVIGAVPSPIHSGNTLWVDKLVGNDTTALRGRQDLPFLTIQAALNAVTAAGDLVIVGPGVYDEKLTLPGFQTYLFGRTASSTINTPNQNPGVQVLTTILDTEAVITTGTTHCTVQGIWFRGQFNAATGTFKCVKSATTSDFYNCRFELNYTGGATSNATALTVSYESAAGQSNYNNCFIQGPGGALSAGSGTKRAVLINGGSARARFINCRTFPETIANLASVEINNAGARGYFWGCEINGDFTVTSAADWWIGPDSYISGTRTTTGTPSIEGIFPNGAHWYDTSTNRLRGRENGVSVDLRDADEATGAFAFLGTLSPAQITANQNDYAPAGLSTVVLLRINTDAARNITGIATGADGRVLVIVNTGSFVISLLHESASSTAANRFTFDGANINLAPSAALVLIYDNTSSRWRAIGTATPPRARTPVVATGTITTASTTDVLATSMTDTPTAGVWLAIFRGGYGNSTATALTTASIWFNGSQVSGTECGSDEHNANYRTPFMTCAVITTTGVGAVEGRWRVSAGTGSMLNRSLILVKLVA